MTKALKTEEQIQKEVESGKYRDTYLIYCRKSTDEPDNQQNSLGYQKDQNIPYSKREGLRIAQLTFPGFCTEGIISEKHSAFKDSEQMTIKDGSVQFKIERPKFHLLVSYLHKGLFKGVIFLSWDRASRKSSDSTIIKKLIKGGVDIRFVLANYDKTSSGDLHMDIDDMFAEHHSRVTSEKVRLATEKNKKEGFCTNKAPVGYLNQGDMRNKPFDPERAPIVKRMFELADTGWSLADIARWATEQGFTMPPTRRRRTKQEIMLDEDDNPEIEVERPCRTAKYTTVQRILRNRAYTGMIKDENGLWAKSNSFEALVSNELFESVQNKLTAKNKSKKYNLPLDNPFRNIFSCDECKRSYTPYYKKGHLYLGCRCKEGCTNQNRSINISFISDKVGALVQSLSFTKEQLEEIDARASTDIALLEMDRQTKIEDGERKKKKLREDLTYLRTNKLTLLKTSTYSPEEMLAEETRLESEIENLIIEEHISEVAMQETMKDVTKLSELLERVAEYWKFAEPHEKEAITREIFSELTVYENNLKYQVTPGFRPFATKLFPLGAGGGT